MQPSNPSVVRSAWRYWRDLASRDGGFRATKEFFASLWEFVIESTPSHRRQRFGDADYDWDYRVNTTSGAIGWRDRLLGEFFSAYQPTEPSLFHEMLSALQEQVRLDLRQFTFIDLGSGKGRTLLMASDYPFKRIIGVELLPALNSIAQQNLKQYKSASQQCFALESVCADATRFNLPDGPLVVYLFNPFLEAPLREALSNLEDDLRKTGRLVYVLYHNPVHDSILGESPSLTKLYGTHQYSIFSRSVE